MTVTNNGLNDVAALLSNWTYVAVGDGATEPTQADTALSGSELGRTARSVYDVAGAVATIEALLTSAVGNGNIREMGIYNAAAAGTLFEHGVFGTTYVKTSDDEFVAACVITFS